nr:hypothetical protein [uncultured Desulfobulbus sp.]
MRTRDILLLDLANNLTTKGGQWISCICRFEWLPVFQATGFAGGL